METLDDLEVSDRETGYRAIYISTLKYWSSSLLGFTAGEPSHRQNKERRGSQPIRWTN